MKTWQQTALAFSTGEGIIRKKGEKTREEFTFLYFMMQNYRGREENWKEKYKFQKARIFLRERLEELRAAEGSEERTCSTEDLGTSPQPKAHPTTGLQGGTRCTAGHVLGVPYRYRLGLLRTRSRSIPAVGTPESTHTLSTLALFYLVTTSRHARNEVRASHHFRSHKMNVTCSSSAHQGGGCNTTSLVHWEKPIKHRRGKWC